MLIFMRNNWFSRGASIATLLIGLGGCPQTPQNNYSPPVNTPVNPSSHIVSGCFESEDIKGLIKLVAGPTNGDKYILSAEKVFVSRCYDVDGYPMYWNKQSGDYEMMYVGLEEKDENLSMKITKINNEGNWGTVEGEMYSPMLQERGYGYESYVLLNDGGVEYTAVAVLRAEDDSMGHEFLKTGTLTKVSGP